MSPKLKSWLLLGGIFVIGVVTGSALTIGLGPRFAHAPERGEMKQRMMAHLTKRLNLTPDQQAKIQPIVDDADGKMQALLHEDRQRSAEIFKDADEQIAALLTPDQQADLKSLEAEREKMFHGKFGHGGHEDQPPPGPAPPPPPPPSPPANKATGA
jgi:Spy/CpxP family protein refolding chaperone